jgi:hypothetical protein
MLVALQLAITINPVIPSEVARLLLPRSLRRTTRASQSRNPSSIDRASLEQSNGHHLDNRRETLYGARRPSG